MGVKNERERMGGVVVERKAEWMKGGLVVVAVSTSVKNVFFT